MGKPPIPSRCSRPTVSLTRTYDAAKGASHGPDLPGRSRPSRPDRGRQDFLRELEAGRNADYQRSEQRIGIVKEAWYLARTPAGDQLVAYLESPDFPAALSTFSQSQDQFDQWFKQRLADATGLDLNSPPTAPLPELLSSYPANGRR